MDNSNTDIGVQIEALMKKFRGQDASVIAKTLVNHTDETIAATLLKMHAPQVLDLFERLPKERIEKIRTMVNPEKIQQWGVNATYPKQTIGRVMTLPVGVVKADLTVAQTIEQLREEVEDAFITYLYVVDGNGTLTGLVVMRDLLLADRDSSLAEVMITNPFTLSPEMSVGDAMKHSVAKHFPVYPVTSEDGRLVGLIRGEDLFEQNMFEIVVQAGSMVGVVKEERASTPWFRSFKMRHPWLQVNLLTALIAGGVVSLFEDTINQIVALAVFLPVLAGQSGNTGCQALAVAIRGLTLGDLKGRNPLALVSKEALMGFLNGAIIGVIAGIIMFFYAQQTGAANPLMLSVVVFLAMTGSCVASGVFGNLIPIVLKKFGADPATASSIFLTTATDVISMGLLLGLASVLVL